MSIERRNLKWSTGTLMGNRVPVTRSVIGLTSSPTVTVLATFLTFLLFSSFSVASGGRRKLRLPGRKKRKKRKKMLQKKSDLSESDQCEVDSAM